MACTGSFRELDLPASKVRDAGRKPSARRKIRLVVPHQRHILVENQNQSELTQALPRRLGMWSDLLIALLLSLPALIYGAVEWLTYLQ